MYVPDADIESSQWGFAVKPELTYPFPYPFSQSSQWGFAVKPEHVTCEHHAALESSQWGFAVKPEQRARVLPARESLVSGDLQSSRNLGKTWGSNEISLVSGDLQSSRNRRVLLNQLGKV